MRSVNFDRAAGFYDTTRALPAQTMVTLTDLLAPVLAARQPCLEIGVGTGRFALPLRGRGISLAGADISGAMLRQLVVNAGGASPVPVLQADATRLPVTAGSFGSVLAVHVLHLIPDWRIAVDEAVRVLRPGGALIASFPTDNRPVTRPDGAAPPGPAGPSGGPGPGPDAAASGTALGLSRDARAPWAAAVRTAAERHGMTRVAIGATEPEAVAGYLAGRATARQLDPVPVRSVTTLGEAIDHIDRQLFSWTWQFTAEQARAAAEEIRAWARQAEMPLDTAHETETVSRWWSFELTG